MDLHEGRVHPGKNGMLSLVSNLVHLEGTLKKVDRVSQATS